MTYFLFTFQKYPTLRCPFSWQNVGAIFVTRFCL